MMKKTVKILAALAVAFSLVGCTGEKHKKAENSKDHTIDELINEKGNEKPKVKLDPPMQ